MRLVALGVAVLLFGPAPAPPRQDAPPKPALVLANAKIHTVAGPPIEGGSILIENGRIKAVGKSISITSDAKIVDLAGRVIIPGLVDVASGLFIPPDETPSGGGA